MLRALGLCLILGAVFAAPASAQSPETLADIRAELSALAEQLQALRAELVSGGAEGLQSAGGTSAIDRMNAMEAEVVRLTARTEELQNRIDRVVADGTNRIGDLEFRLCELEPGCDLSALPITARLGGDGAPAVAAPALPTPATAPIVELAINEQADFDRARGALEGGDYRAAADQFHNFVQAYPGGPLNSEAHFLRGEALARMGETSQSATAYLDSFSGDPNGPHAAPSLLRLGAALGLLGQVQEACLILTEVGIRFPGAAEVPEAQTAMQELQCP